MDPMQNNNQQPTGANTTPETSMNTPEANAPTKDMTPSKGGVGPIVGAIIVIAILVIGALYFFSTSGGYGTGAMMSDEEKAMMDGNANTSSELDADAMSADKDLNTLDADIEASMSGLDENL